MGDFLPIAEDMAVAGCSKEQIVKAYQAQMKVKTNQYYNNLTNMKSIKSIIKDQNFQAKADSKAELIFCEMLTKENIRFEFQYVIGPYRADYLIEKFLVVEIDGAQHDPVKDARRDKYMEKMGYRIFRIPLWLLIADPSAAVAEIKTQTSIRRIK